MGREKEREWDKEKLTHHHIVTVLLELHVD
jgi:hypothetical protein